MHVCLHSKDHKAEQYQLQLCGCWVAETMSHTGTQQVLTQSLTSGHNQMQRCFYCACTVGGNHKAATCLWELFYGGWVAETISYTGMQGVLTHFLTSDLTRSSADIFLCLYSWRKSRGSKSPVGTLLWGLGGKEDLLHGTCWGHQLWGCQNRRPVWDLQWQALSHGVHMLPIISLTPANIQFPHGRFWSGAICAVIIFKVFKLQGIPIPAFGVLSQHEVGTKQPKQSAVQC